MTEILYLGFAGHGNLGDDAIKDALAARLNEFRFYNIPVHKARIAHAIATGEAFGRRQCPLLLGGGTILGRTLWRGHFRRTQMVFKPKSWTMLGAGVEDPAFSGDSSYTSDAEMRQWKPLLERFNDVSVRGPRSREILLEAGIQSTIVGDPALLLEPSGLDRSKDIDILINTTCGDDQWGGRALDWTDRLAVAVAPFVRQGARVAFLRMEKTDEAWNRRTAERLRLPLEEHRPQSASALFDLLASSRMLVGTRLHANVLSAAAGVPSISLEYRPKCRDFMESIGQGGRCFRVDGFDPDEVEAAIEDALQNPSSIQHEILEEVDTLRERLTARLPEVVSEIAA